MHEDGFGWRGGGAQCDFIGLEKTTITLATISLNWILCLEANGPRMIQPEQGPHLTDGTFKGRKPRIGAIFTPAFAAGFEPWPREVKSPAAWRLKLSLLRKDNVTVWGFSLILI
jgi:hypothetical protein